MSVKKHSTRPEQSNPRDSRSSQGETERNRESQGRAEEWRDLGRDAFLSGETAEALRYLRRAVEFDPDDPETWHILGLCFEELGAEPRADRCFALATRLTARVGGSPGRTTAALALRLKGSRRA